MRKERAKETKPRKAYSARSDISITPTEILRSLSTVGDYRIIELTESELHILRNSFGQYAKRPADVQNIIVTCTKIVGVVASSKGVGTTMTLLKVTRIK